MIYKGEHSVTFGDKNSWTDFHLVPTSRPVISLPTFKERYVDIPWRSGVADLGSLLTGGPVYANRIGSIEFLVDGNVITLQAVPDMSGRLAKYAKDKPEVSLDEIRNQVWSKVAHDKAS